MRFHDVLFFKEKKFGQDSEDLVPHFNFTKMLSGHPEHATALSQAMLEHSVE